MKISMILLAAGNSVRYQGNKLLSEWNGKKLFEYAFETAAESRRLSQAKPFAEVKKVIVVTQYDEIEEAAARYGFDVIRNHAPEKGISYSIKLGLSKCTEFDGAVFMVCDQPYLRADTVRRLLEEADGRHIICSGYHERKGNPTFFPKCFFRELTELSGDCGGKILMKKYPNQVKKTEVFEERELMDIDTAKDREKVICGGNEIECRERKFKI